MVSVSIFSISKARNCNSVEEYNYSHGTAVNYTRGVSSVECEWRRLAREDRGSHQYQMYYY